MLKNFIIGMSVVILASCGCGDSNNPLGRLPISGEVLLHGKPLDRGTIEFAPKDKKLPVSTGALIVDGSFEIPTSKGLPPGTYTVRIYATKEISTGEKLKFPEEAGPAPKERIPKEYNKESELEMTVKQGESNCKDFNIP